MRKWFIAVLVVGVVLVGPASAAQAVGTVPAAVAADVPDMENVGGMSLRQKMLTVLGSMLKSDSGVGTSYAHRYSAFETGFSEKKLRKMMEYSTLNPGGPVPQRVQDYVLQAHDFETPIKTDPKTGVKSFRVSPTNGKQLARGLGGLAFNAFLFVPMIGNAGSNVIGSWQGYSDFDREWCIADAQAQEGGFGHVTTMLGLLSGRDCSGYQFSEEYVPNGDLPVTYGSVAGISYRGIGYGFNGSAHHCYQQVGDPVPPSGSRLYYWTTNPEPTWVAISGRGGRLELKGSFSCPTGSTHINRTFVDPVRPELQLRSIDTGEILEEMIEKRSNPSRHIECVVTLDDGSQLTSRGESYTEEEGAFKMPPCPPVPEGRYATNVELNEKMDDGSGSSVLYNEPSTPEYQEWAESFPECADGACLLDVRIKTGPYAGLSCFDNSDECVDWWTDPNKSNNYQCTYGAHDVAIEECAVYSGIFKPGRVAVGAPYSDPMTGDWDGSSSAPRLDGQAMRQTIQDPASTRSCNGLNVTGFDPVGFVMRPIQCALEWAFVPRPLVVEAQLAGGGEAWEGKPPAVIADTVQSFTATPAVSGCSISVTIFSGMFQQNVKPLDACPGSFARPFADASRVITSAVMVVLVVVVVRRQIAGMIGYGQGQ